MGKKAPRRNAYFMFMLDYKRREESRGKRFGNGFQDVSKLASDAWKNLPQEEKDRYKKRADDYNKSEERSQGWPGGSSKKKKTNPPPPPNRALTIKEAKQRREKAFIQNLIENMPINTLLDHVFYLIHVNVFCKTLDDEFVPAEIGISKFSLREGVTNVFHRILNPGETPLGYSYEIRLHSEKTHRIPLDYVKATKGYLGIYNKIMDFLGEKADSRKAPPLYTMFDEPFHNCSMSAVKYSLKRIWETGPMINDSDDDDDDLDEDEKYEKTFSVMSLPNLFFNLKNKCASILDDSVVAFENTSEANIELLNDRYEFNEELACQFHKDIDNVRFCSQSYTVRWAQVIREQCIQNLESDDEEEEENVNEEDERIKRENEDKIKRERELAIKEEKSRDRDDLARDARPIKTERDIKKEKDDIRFKKEKDEKNYALKKEKDEYHREVKKEKDENHREIKKEKDERVKLEKDYSRSESSHSRAIKLERDFENRSRWDRDRRNYDDVRVKSERDERRHYDDVRVKSERDERRHYDDVRVKSERDDRHRRSEDVRVKKERDERYRSSEADTHVRYKTEKHDPDYDSELKNEHFDIPFESETEGYERRDSRDSYKYSERSGDSRSSKNSSRSDYDSIKSERYDSRDSRSRHSHSSRESTRSEIKTERLEIKSERGDSRDSRSRDSEIKTEYLDTPCEIKSERHSRDPRSDRERTRPEYDSAIKTERMDTLVEMKSERHTRDPRSRDSRFDREWARPDYDSILKTEHLDIPFDIDNERHATLDSRSVSEAHQSVPPRVKIERSEGSSSDFPMPIPIKTERSSNETKTSNDTFPLPRPIKIEKDSHSDLSRPIKIEKDSHPDFPVKIKIEKDAHVSEQRFSRDHRDDQSDKNDFPMPIPIKMEKSETSQSTTRNDFSTPMIIKTENPSERSPPIENPRRNDDFPMPIKIKVENRIQEETSSNSRKRNRDSIDSVQDDEDLKPTSVRIKLEKESDTESASDFALSNVRIKNEPPDSYSSHDMKHEEMIIDSEDEVVQEPVVVKQELSCEIKKEKV